MSATPVNQAAPPPTAGPFKARTKTFLWSIIERSISSAEYVSIGYCLTIEEYLPGPNRDRYAIFFSAALAYVSVESKPLPDCTW